MTTPVSNEEQLKKMEKTKAEQLLKAAILEKLNGLAAGQQIMLKITLPDQVPADLRGVQHVRSRCPIL